MNYEQLLNKLVKEEKKINSPDYTKFIRRLIEHLTVNKQWYGGHGRCCGLFSDTFARETALVFPLFLSALGVGYSIHSARYALQGEPLVVRVDIKNY